jgi:tripartite-type tricarboxylate transporter receptor subunit TctC
VLPDVPAIGEVVSGYEASAYQGIGAPKNTPPDIINRLNKEVNLALAGPSFQKRLTELGAEPFETASPSDFRKFVGDYTEKWANLIREVNITAE